MCVYFVCSGDVLNGNSAAASLLAEAVHSDVSVSMDTTFDHVTGEIPLSDVCIWIDPIGKIYFTMSF